MAERLGRIPPTRSPWGVTLAVWRALFMREILNRISRERFAWVWMLVEPVAHIAILGWMLTSGIRTRTVAGGDVIVFLILGIQGFFMFRNIMNRGIDAVDSSASLYAFRQVKPVDTIIARALNAGFMEILIFITIFSGAALLGYSVVPKDPLLSLGGLFGLWLLGLGLALTLSVPSALVPEFGHTVRLLMTPMYFFSAVIFPSIKLPIFLREYLLMNPVLHALECMRIGFMPAYVVPPGISLGYVYACAIPFIFFGLALQLQFRARLMTR
jgi:capsular polysaccharide transport system permease protein